MNGIKNKNGLKEYGLKEETEISGKKYFKSSILHLPFNLLLLVVRFTIKLPAWLDIFKLSAHLGKDKAECILFHF